MTLLQYNKAKETLLFIWSLKPPIDQIVKYLTIMNESLVEELGFSSKKEIIAKIATDISIIGLSRTKIRQLLWEEDV
jgi:hypothetical protein